MTKPDPFRRRSRRGGGGSHRPGANRHAESRPPTRSTESRSDDSTELYRTLMQALGSLPLAYVHVGEVGDRSLTQIIRDTWAGPLVLNPHPTLDSFPATPETAAAAVARRCRRRRWPGNDVVGEPRPDRTNPSRRPLQPGRSRHVLRRRPPRLHRLSDSPSPRGRDSRGRRMICSADPRWSDLRITDTRAIGVSRAGSGARLGADGMQLAMRPIVRQIGRRSHSWHFATPAGVRSREARGPSSRSESEGTRPMPAGP